MKREGVNFSPFTVKFSVLLLTQIVYDNNEKYWMEEIMVINFKSKEAEESMLIEAFIKEAQAVTITDEERDAAYERLMQRVHEAANK